MTTGDPVLLAIETAGSRCSVAVTRGPAVLAVERRELRHGHAEALMPMVERVTAEAGLTPSQLRVVAATVGPGGFTGIRVGLAAAHGIALAVGARLVGVSSFAAVAAGLSAAERLNCEILLVALDSRRSDLYVQPFTMTAAGDAPAPLAAPTAVLPERLADYAATITAQADPNRKLLIAGDAAETAAAALDGHVDLFLASESAPDALGVASAALRQLCAETAPSPVRPLYLRPPDVTLPKQRASNPAP
jgi:tRNA threonylcarbamoyladenosine biosynthesis protein TsaB